MKFYEQFNKYMEEADIERLSKRDSREEYEDELDRKEAYKTSLLRRDDENAFKGDLDSHNFEGSEEDEDPIGDEIDVFEYLGQFRQDNPELFNKFTELLKSDRFVHQVRSMRGVSL